MPPSTNTTPFHAPMRVRDKLAHPFEHSQMAAPMRGTLRGGSGLHRLLPVCGEFMKQCNWEATHLRVDIEDFSAGEAFTGGCAAPDKNARICSGHKFGDVSNERTAENTTPSNA